MTPAPESSNSNPPDASDTTSAASEGEKATVPTPEVAIEPVPTPVAVTTPAASSPALPNCPPEDLPEGWHHALPERVPRRTYTPAILAAGMVLLIWGFITSPILTGAGIGLLGFGVAGWIEELEFERR